MGQTEKQICGTTHIGARRPLCTHGHALRRGNGRGVPSGITRRLAAFFPPSEVHSPCAPRPHFHRQRLSLRFAGGYSSSSKVSKKIVATVPPPGRNVKGYFGKVENFLFSPAAGLRRGQKGRPPRRPPLCSFYLQRPQKLRLEALALQPPANLGQHGGDVPVQGAPQGEVVAGMIHAKHAAGAVDRFQK